VKGRCKSCGSTRAPDTSYMSPRAARVMRAADGYSMGVAREIGDEIPF